MSEIDTSADESVEDAQAVAAEADSGPDTSEDISDSD